MKSILFFSLLISCLFCFSQKPEKKYGSYQANLYKVDGVDASEFILLDSVKSIYEDSLMRIEWTYNHYQMNFKLTNQSNQTMKVIWNDAAFIDVNNMSERVYHKGIPFTEKEETQVPTVLYKNSILSDLVSPVSFTYMFNNHWTSDILIPGDNILDHARKTIFEKYIGKTIRVVLPIYVGARLIEYDFCFRISFKEISSTY